MLYLVRHAEPLNALIKGDAPLLPDEASLLTPRGEAQARALAESFRTLRHARIHSSPMPRAHQTAQPLAAACGATITLDARLAERDFSKLSGLSAAASRNLQEQNYLNPVVSLLGEETLASQRSRVREWLADHQHLIAESATQPMIVVCHGGTIEHLFAELIGIPLAAMSRYFLACDFACFVALRPVRLGDGRVVYRVEGVNQRSAG